MKVIKWVIGLPVAFLAFLFALGAILKATDTPPSASTQSSAAIDLCWQEQAKKSNTPDQARFIAGACEKMEADAKAAR